MYLYKIYKNIKQRSKRDPYCDVREEMTQLARQIFEGEKSSEDILAIASKLKSLEIQLYDIRTYFSDQIKDAVETMLFEQEEPASALEEEPVVDDMPLAANDEEKLCPCPDDDEEM